MRCARRRRGGSRLERERIELGGLSSGMGGSAFAPGARRFGATDFASASDSPAWTKLVAKRRAKSGGEAGIRTLGTTLRSYNGLANRRLRPLGHLTAIVGRQRRRPTTQDIAGRREQLAAAATSSFRPCASAPF